MSDSGDQKRLVANPDDVAPADQAAAELGVPVQVSTLVPPGVAYLVDPDALREAIEDDKPDLFRTAGRIDGLSDLTRRRYFC